MVSPRLHRVSPADQVLGCHTLEHHGRGLFFTDTLRQFDQTFRWEISRLCIGTQGTTRIGHPIPG